MTKIPVLETIASAYRFTFEQLGAIIGLIWIPQLLASVIEYLTSRPYSTRIIAGDTAAAAGPEHILALGGQVISFCLFAVMAVAVTRQALGLRKGPAIAYFSVGRPEARVFSGTAAMMFLGGASFLAITLLAGLLDNIPGVAGQLASSAAVLVLAGGLVYAMTRLTFLLVPASITHDDYGIERSWLMTQGNFWRIFAVMAACIGPIVLVSIIAFIAMVGPDYFPKDLGVLRDEQAMLQFQASQARVLARAQPAMLGLAFALAPFTFGLSIGAAASVFKFLSGARPVAVKDVNA